jgi:hypothetical protein
MTSPQEILKASIIQLIDLWNETLSNDYMLHIEYTHYQEGSEVNLLIDHYLFGDVDWSNYDRARWHEQSLSIILCKLFISPPLTRESS